MKKVSCLLLFISGLALHAQNGLPKATLTGPLVTSKERLMEGSKTFQDHSIPDDSSAAEQKEEERKESKSAEKDPANETKQANPLINGSSDKKDKKSSPNTR